MANLGSIFRLLIWDPFNRIFYSFLKNSFKRNQFQFFSPCFHSSIQFAFLSLDIIFSAIVFFIFTSCHRHHRLLLRPLLHLSLSSSSSAIIFIIFVFILSYHHQTSQKFRFKLFSVDAPIFFTRITFKIVL